MEQVRERMDALEKRMVSFEKCAAEWRDELNANTAITLRIEGNTKELVELLKIARNSAGFFLTAGRIIRKLAIWLGPFIAMGSFIYAILHGKIPGPPP